MPPPNDEWLTKRRFGIVVDAGSSGSRLQIYSWTDPRATKATAGGDSAILDALPRVEKGTRNSEEWVHKVEPGISSFAGNPTAVGTYLRPLLAHAVKHIPPSLHAETPIFLLATAGMRLLSSKARTDLIRSTCSFFRFHSNFRLDGPNASGPCGSSVRVITGEEEGLFGWIAVNYLMDGFAGHDVGHRATYGFLDMGGASTQIAFEPSKAEKEGLSAEAEDQLVEVRLRLLSGEEIRHKVFVTTWLGYGTNQARERYVDLEVEAASASPDSGHVVLDPCLPRNLSMTETSVAPLTMDTPQPYTLHGTGSFTNCLTRTEPLLNKDMPCPASSSSCLFNGVAAPKIDFNTSKFIGVSEYWYSSDHVFGLGGAYDYVSYERAASEFCSREWGDILRQHQTDTASLPHSGDGEVEDSMGKIVEVGKWGNHVEVSRLQMQCFKAAWIVNMLHVGIGLPRIVDRGGNSTRDEGADAEEKAGRKGLGRPTFQSVDSIGDTAISWTLGKMVLEASKEVPALSASLPPIQDPSPDALPVMAPPAGESRGRFSGIRHRLHEGSWVPAYVLIVLVCGFLVFKLRRRLRPKVGIRRRLSKAGENVGFFEVDEAGNTSSSSSSSSSAPMSRPASPASATQTTRGIFRSAQHILRHVPFFRSSSPTHSPARVLTPSSSNGILSLPLSLAHPTPPPPPRRPAFRQTKTLPVSLALSPSNSSTNGRNYDHKDIMAMSKINPTYDNNDIHDYPSSIHTHSYSYSSDDMSPPSPTTARPGTSLGIPTPSHSTPLANNTPYANMSRNSSQVNLSLSLTGANGGSLVPRTVSFARSGGGGVGD